MRTKLRACSRGKDYLPREVSQEQNPYSRAYANTRDRRSSRESTSATSIDMDNESVQYANTRDRRSSRESTSATSIDMDNESVPTNETLSKRLQDIQHCKSITNKPAKSVMTSPCVLPLAPVHPTFPRHEALLSTNPSPTPPTSSEEPTIDFFLYNPEEKRKSSAQCMDFRLLTPHFRNRFPQKHFKDRFTFPAKSVTVSSSKSGKKNSHSKANKTQENDDNNILTNKQNRRSHDKVKTTSMKKSKSNTTKVRTLKSAAQACTSNMNCCSSSLTTDVSGINKVYEQSSFLLSEQDISTIALPQNANEEMTDQHPESREVAYESVSQFQPESSAASEPLGADPEELEQLLVTPQELEHVFLVPRVPERVLVGSQLVPEHILAAPQEGAVPMVLEPEEPDLIPEPQQLEPVREQEAECFQNNDYNSDIPMAEDEGLQENESLKVPQFGDVNSTSESGDEVAVPTSNSGALFKVVDPSQESTGPKPIPCPMPNTVRGTFHYMQLRDNPDGVLIQRPYAAHLPAMSHAALKHIMTSGLEEMPNMEEGWQEQACSNSVRDKMIYEHQKWTDITFYIGPNKEKFGAHRVYLAKSSEVFEHLLYEDNKIDEITFENINPHYFYLLLKFIYEGYVPPTSIVEACEMLILLKRFRLDKKIIARCRAFIFVRIFPVNAWCVLNFAFQQNEEELFETALKVCRNLLTSDEFYHVSLELLVKMVSNDALHYETPTELTLYRACLRWAQHQLEASDDTDIIGLRQLLDPVLQHIRFLTMSLPDFVKVCDLKPSVLSENEKLDTLSYLASPNEHPKPSYICQKIADSTNVNRSFFTFAIPYEDTQDDELGLVRNTFDFLSTVAFTFNSDNDEKTINVVQIPSQISPNDGNYDEKLTIYIRELESHILSVAHFAARVNFNSYINVQLSAPIHLSELPSNTICVKVLFHTAGRYPSAKCLHQMVSYSGREPALYNSEESFIHLLGYNS